VGRGGGGREESNKVHLGSSGVWVGGDWDQEQQTGETPTESVSEVRRRVRFVFINQEEGAAGSLDSLLPGPGGGVSFEQEQRMQGLGGASCVSVCV
jgi:hypothetical protein